MFFWLAWRHAGIDRGIRRHRAWLAMKKKQVARMRLDWQALPQPPENTPDPEHPFELDLDITGPRSLYRLLDTAVSRDGSLRLRTWLLQEVPDFGRIRQRQQRVRDLIPLTHFRNKLHLAFAMVAEAQLDGSRLLAWLQARRAPAVITRLLWLLGALAATNAILVGLYLAYEIPAYWAWSLFAYIAIFLWNARHLTTLLEDSTRLDDETSKLRAILIFLERYRYQPGSQLESLTRLFREHGRRPSQQLRRVRLGTTLAGLRGNPVMALLLNAALPWDYLCAWLLDRNRQALAGSLPAWLDTFAELEALLSLANFGHLIPEATFPQLLDQSRPCYQSEKLGHPLIRADERVSNDFTLDDEGQLVLITGSNMAGKSTFLKTLGVNLCLAFSGAPVTATALVVSPFRIFTCIKINDSITDGFSFFYAEVRRLRRLLTLLQDDEQTESIFYLIDEIFRGTNNRERLIGSRSYIRALARERGLGVISTHDLELVNLADSIAGLRNFHFRETVEDGKMTFDYRLRRGPCPTTNALKIMQLAGLPVESDEAAETASRGIQKE